MVKFNGVLSIYKTWKNSSTSPFYNNQYTFPSHPHIIQKLGRRLNTADQQMVSRASTGNVENIFYIGHIIIIMRQALTFCSNKQAK